MLSIVAAILEGEPGAFVTLVYANRTSRSVMFLDEVHDLKDRLPERFQILHVLSREQQDVELLSGRLDADRLRGDPRRAVPAKEVDDWFLCGPQQMVDELRGVLTDAGADPDPHRAVPRRPGPARACGRARRRHRRRRVGHDPARRPGQSSSRCVPTDVPRARGRRCDVRSDLPFACKGGVCGTCRARLLEGTVQMDANYALEPDEIERGYVLTCQSHPTSAKVVLDYDA